MDEKDRNRLSGRSMRQIRHIAKAKEKYGKQEEFLDHLKQEIETITAPYF